MATIRLAALALVAGALACAAPQSLVVDHAWIVVATEAPERAVLEQAGFRFAPWVNRHDGQGTASITIELENAFLELIYPDPTVPVSPATQAGAEKFRLKSQWRESGYSPIGIVLARTSAPPETFPFETWKVSADWMEPGTFIEMLTPKSMPKAVSLSISSHAQTTREINEALARDPNRNAVLQHANGARRLTGVRVTAPDADGLPQAAWWLTGRGVLTVDVSGAWLLEVTLDAGIRGSTQDLRPALPLVIHR